VRSAECGAMGSEGGVQRFEDLIAWQNARELAKVIYQMTGKSSFSKILDFVTRFREPLYQSCQTWPKGLI